MRFAILLRFFRLGTLILPLLTTALRADEKPDKLFPVEGILPKEEIGALRFLAQHPEYDGRGVVVAVFDTGVDPGAAGLLTTTDGKPKIIDMIDGTGSGDVVTTTVRALKDGKIEGLTGRLLKVDPSWEAEGHEFHVGIKTGFDFFPGGLIARLKRERRKRFDREQRKTEVAVRRQIIEWDQKYPEPTADQKRERAELSTRLEQLKAVSRQYVDPGPVYDCVVFHDGDVWRAVIDTDEDSDLRDEKLLTNYRAEREFATFGEGTHLNFAVNIFEKGNRLSIVSDCGDHGTHVAGIIAGHFSDQPELNGVAPGAQIVSVKIGDARLGSMEIGTGLVRGLKTVVENNCDLINMSFGEPTTAPNRGKLISLFSNLVDQQGVIFVSSAGNSGPALSTVGAPGGTASAIIGVGAYVSPKMMAAEYMLREELPEMPYTWTSRGPTADGDLGVDIFAPGGAIASVSSWTLNCSSQKNGTSMASPNACGAIALLVSGLKAKKIAYSPHSIRRAIGNSARTIDAADVFAQGPGLIQVNRAFEYLEAHHQAMGELLRFRVEVPDRNGARGIYLREPFELNHPLETAARVRPIFGDAGSKRDQLNFEMRLKLESKVSWISTGEFLLLSSGGRSFQLRVDPTKLEPGVHYSEVCGFDAEHPSRGPIFRVPVTVVKPLDLSDEGGAAYREELEFTPGQIARRFIAVPEGATWADLILQSHDEANQKHRYVIHPLQMIAGRSLKQAQPRKYVTLEPGRKVVQSFSVSGGRTLELCISQYWSSLGKSNLEYELVFHGLKPNTEEIILSSGNFGQRVEVVADVAKERVSPSGLLTTRRQMLHPTETLLRPLNPERDQLPNGDPIYELILTYEFDQAAPGLVTPRFPLNDGLLYDSPFSSQLWMLFDEGKRRIAADDIWPQAVRLGKGKHVLKLQLRDPNVELLETAKTAVLLLDRKLGRAISLSTQSTEVEANGKRAGFGSRLLQVGERVGFYVQGPSEKSLSKTMSAGDILLGTMTFGQQNSSQTGSGRRPNGFLVRYVVPPRKSSETSTSPKTSLASPARKENLADAVRDFKVAELKKLADPAKPDEFETLATQLLKEYPNHVPILVAKLHLLDDVKHRKEHLPKVIAAADVVISKIGSDKKQREALIDALYRKGRGLAYRELPEVLAKHPIADKKAHDKAFESNFAALRKLVDTTQQKYFLLHIRRERRQGRFGNALKLLNRYIGNSAPNYWYIKKRRDLYKKLGWQHCWEYERRWLMIRFPGDYEAF